MAGFWQRLFQRDQESVQPEKPKKKDNSFFLDPDDAKTFGDIDYMRTPRTVKRTFAAMNGKDVGELVLEVSAKEQKVIKTQPTTQSTKASESESSSQQPAPSPERRRADTSLDSFRSMARDLRK